MKISTSINISISRKKKLIAAAKLLGVTISDILSALMARSRLHYDTFSAAIWESVDYQPDAFLEGEEYVIMHVSLDPLCYEFGVSERLCFKVSVSFIYRVAIDQYLDTLVEKGLNCAISADDVATNYSQLDYDISYNETTTHEFWLIKWGKRTKKTKPKERQGI